mmetsp:Transcript_97092/g.274439  ORF Transcript_97092/g.274439 Transcript_97092/m.274439 type:complete len:389 (+) Transcript_97092:56-1222(+)|eukprot:CAMPEP_0117471418 /NCGR_PEP_ID=MMETSP0784-20121206/7720_1 /TAXON_ID=39447 /ORGANISM="" /LENGTH=388 /DNA_ID=CAMNT_0005265535 /DNA_START=58 /DNA_END=1224 /DNA_ORIENTATION=+
MTSGGFAQPGVTYPRELDVSLYEGLPPGWKAIESAYKSGAYMGKTYVRFKGPVAGTSSILTVKKAIHCDALKVKGLSEADADRLAEEFEKQQQAKEEQRKREREEAGFLTGDKREEAVAAFRAKYGPMDGATVANLPGWSTKSIYRETCNQLAVTYYNPEGRPFNTVKDVETMFGVQVLKGVDIEEVATARSKLETDETGRVINKARREINETQTVNKDDAEKQGQKRQRASWDADNYAESKSLVLLQVPIGTEWSPTDIPGVEAEELQRSAVEIHAALVDRCFPQTVKLLVLRGCESERLQPALMGFFYMRMDAFNHRPIFQRVFQTSKGSMPIACNGVHIFWSTSRSRWTMGRLHDEEHAYAFACTDVQDPTETALHWMVVKEPVD